MRDEILDILKKLCELPSLAPAAAAQLLCRRLQLVSEDENLIRYAGIGGVVSPFATIELRWGKRRASGFVRLEVAPSVRLTAEEVLSEWMGRPVRSISGNRNQRPHEVCCALNLGAVELRFSFASGEPLLLRSCVVSRLGVATSTGD